MLDKASKRKTRELEAEVLRAILHRIPHCPDTALYGNVQNGLNLVSKVAKDKEERTIEGRNLTESWWQEVYTTYSLHELLAERVTVANRQEPLDPNLVAAIDIARHRSCIKRTRSPQQSWCRNATDMNQRSLCGIVSYMHSLRPAANAEIASVFVNFLKMAKRLDIKLNFPKDLCL